MNAPFRMRRTTPLLFAVAVLLFSTTSWSGAWQQGVSIGGFNSVHLYTPDSVSPVGDGRSLLIVLHGCVQPISNYLTANLEDAAETYGMVVAVPDAMVKAGYSCWSYWQGAINRSSGDYANLINLANTLSGDPARNIDTDQVYIAGLSSGAAFAAQTACVAPDIFAGVAPSAGPTIGTSSNGAIDNCEVVSPTTFRNRCEGYAGSYQSYLNTQVAAVGHGTADTTVDTCYNQQNANGYASVYGVTQLSGSTTISDGPGHTAQEALWTGQRIAMLWFDGLDHSWSGGQGASGSYVAADSINFASYLGDFFAVANQRVDRNDAPTIANHLAFENNGALDISGTAADSDGTVAGVDISIERIDQGSPVLVEQLSAGVGGSGAYSTTSSALSDGLYQAVAVATDNEGKASQSASSTARIGPEPASGPPQLSDITVTVNGQCATVSGTVVDPNQDLTSVEVEFANGTAPAGVTGNSYSAQGCDLPGGSNLAVTLAADATGQSSTQSISFEIDAGVTGDYNLHIQQGHIEWGYGYSECYIVYGTAEFTMREYDAGSGQCRWIDDEDASCAGRAQACMGGGGGPSDGDGDGVADSADNCPNDANADQADNDADGIGNVCDPTPNGTPDADGDGVADSADNCPNDANADQADNDSDGIGNVCDATPEGEVECSETTSSNYHHVTGGRAWTNGSYVFANGSNQNMGFYNVYVTKTLAETSPGYFVIGSCP